MRKGMLGFILHAKTSQKSFLLRGFFVKEPCLIKIFYSEVSLVTDEDYMREALRAAENAQGRTSPNPLVGAVIVRERRIIATGWHREAGTPHAEIHALRMAGELARGATLYVTLEPCAHYGRTGPCAKAVAEAGIARVVIALQDPNPKVAGKGMAILEEAGIEVKCGVLAREAARLNEAFLKWIQTGLPLVAMKTAMSLDGKIATFTGASQWITGEAARHRVHEYRDVYDGILAGIGTVLADDPSLTTRLEGGTGKNPVRIITDSMARTPLGSRLLTDGAAPVLIAVTEAAPKESVEALKSAGAEIIVAGPGPQVDMALLMRALGEREITSVFVEGGGTVNFSLLKAGLVDKVYAFVAPKIIGGREAKTPVEGEGFAELSEAAELIRLEAETVGRDVLLTGYVQKEVMPLWLQMDAEES